jgi:cytoskeletal protein RodZ
MASELKEAREKAGYTIEEVSKRLNIRKQYLVSIEEEKYEDMPGQIYVEGYKKMYYKFLGLKLPINDSKKVNNAADLRPVETTDKNKFQKYVVFISMILLVGVILLYSVLKQGDNDNYNNIINNEFLDD